MNRILCARDERRFIGLDVHKHYITIGGMNAHKNLSCGSKCGDGTVSGLGRPEFAFERQVVLEATTIPGTFTISGCSPW